MIESTLGDCILLSHEIGWIDDLNSRARMNTIKRIKVLHISKLISFIWVPKLLSVQAFEWSAVKPDPEQRLSPDPENRSIRVK